MAVRPVVKLGDPILRKGAAPVEASEIGSPEVSEIIADLIDTHRSMGGVGLAAPQIGVSRRIVVAEIPPATEMRMRRYGDTLELMHFHALPMQVMINPRVVQESSDRAIFFEWCLSADAYAGLIPRSTEIEVQFLDGTGAECIQTFSGWAARVVHHEIDHLDGVICLDLALRRSLVSVDSWRETWARRHPVDAGRELGVSFD